MRSENYSKRQFVRTFAFGTASTVIGTPWIASLLLTMVGEQRVLLHFSSGEGGLNNPMRRLL